MSTPRSMAEMKEWVFRSLGAPVIEVNLSEHQVEDAISDALSFWRDYHYEGSKKIYIARKLTCQDVQTKQIVLDKSIQSVIKIFRFTGDAEFGSPDDIFNVDYQLRLNDLWDLTSVNLTGYVIARQYISLIDDILNTDIQIRFRQHEGILYLDTARFHLPVGTYIMIECYQHLLTPEELAEYTPNPLPSAGSCPSPGSYYPNQYGTGYENGGGFTEGNIPGPPYNGCVPPDQYVPTVVPEPPGRNIWNDRVLRQLCVAYARRRWALNLLKFEGVSLPGGVTVNGSKMLQTAETEIEKLENDFIRRFMAPDEFYLY